MIEGFLSVSRALGLVRRKPRLLVFLMMAPWTLNLVIFLGSWSLLTLYFTGEVGTYLKDIVDAWWTPLLTGFGYFVAVLVAAGLAYGITVIGAVVVAAPFYDRLSFEAERVSHPDLPMPPTRLGALGAFKEGAKTALVLLILETGLLVCYLVPVAGPFLFALATAYALTLGLLDVPLARHGLSLKQKAGFVRRNAGGVFGLSLALLAVSIVPFLNLLSVPVFVMAATLLTASRVTKEAAKRAEKEAPEPAGPGGAEGTGA